MIDAGYGDTNSGKSQALERLANHIINTTGKEVWVYVGDGGADTYNSHGLVDDGKIKLLEFSHYDYPMTVLKLISSFYFLKDWKDPDSKLVAPPADLAEKVGLIIYEGGSVIGNWLLSDVPGGLGWHAASGSGFGGIKDEDDVLTTKDEFKGFEAASGKDDFLEQGANSPKHYMISQRKIVNAIRKTRLFPGAVYWTFHATEGPDKGAGGKSGKYGAEITGKGIIGPDVGGKALASSIGREFGNLHHFDQVSLTKKVKDPTSGKLVTNVEKEFRLYTRRHHDPDQDVLVEYVAGSRIVGLKEYYKSNEPGDSLLQFYQDVKRIRDEQRAKRGTEIASEVK